MYRELTVKAVSVALTLVLVTVPPLNTANAGVVSTQDAFALEARQAQIDEVRRLLAQTNVREALIRYGVEPAMSAQRVTTLTDAELTTLEANLNEPPSGSRDWSRHAVTFTACFARDKKTNQDTIVPPL